MLNFFRLVAYVSKLTPFQLPVNSAVEPIQTFLEKNSPPLLHIALSNFENTKKCKKLLDDSEQASHMVDDMKQVIQKPPAPSSHHKQHHPKKKTSKYLIFSGFVYNWSTA